MKCLLMFFCFSVLSFNVSGQEEYELRVEISGIKKVRGKVGICLITDPKEFLSNCHNYSEVSVSSQELTFSKEAVKPGSYVVTIYQDANDNGKLDTNMLGMPKERYGFSNNPGSRFGPPGFKKCLFEVKTDTTIHIRLR